MVRSTDRRASDGLSSKPPRLSSQLQISDMGYLVVLRGHEHHVAFWVPDSRCYNKCEITYHYAKDCKVKNKNKNLNIDEEMKQSLCKILLNSSLENSNPDQSDEEELSADEGLRDLQNEDYMSSEDECLPYYIGQPCDNKDEDDFFL
ncbi:hypothetical protein CQW23_14244 [Capsicum baccatum]|uniref:Uncharacterized protein n=1 Tax=Capsicum baccatum TaxID=33114 RepID=A0A2G2WIL2_CAPBA|nr:hypothetical protein CQW23_14244 [Capsicum baccatum]